MNQFVLFHFAKTIEDKYFQFSMQPQSTWEQIDQALVEFREAMVKLKEEKIKEEEDRKAKEAAQAVEPEVVGEG